MALNDIVDVFAKENEISVDLAKEVLAEIMTVAYKRKFGKDYENLEVKFGKTLRLSQLKTVVKPEEFEDSVLQILPEEARAYTQKKEIEEGDVIKVPFNPTVFGRQTVQITKQVLKQKVNDIQKDLVYNEFHNKIDTILTGKIKSKTDYPYGGYYVSIEPKGTEAFLPYREAISEEYLEIGDMVKVLLKEVKEFSRRGEPQLILSRASEIFAKLLIRNNIPEIADGTFIIKGCARKPGEVTKLALESTNILIDPISITVGKAGVRIKPIREELGGERIEIIKWDKEAKIFITNAITASRVLKNRIAEVFHIDLDFEKNEASIVTSNEFVAPLIGKKGSHRRMLEEITGWGVHFIPYSEYKDELELKNKNIDKILGLEENEEVEFDDDEDIAITELPFTEEQIELLRSVNLTSIIPIIELNISGLLETGLDEANVNEIWKIIEDNIEVDEE